MDSTTALLWAAALAVTALVAIIVATAKKSSPRHIYPSTPVYFAVAASIVLSVASPRLTSTSVDQVADTGIGGAIAKVATIAAVVGFALAFLLSLGKKRKIPALAGALIAYGAIGVPSAILNNQPLEWGMAYVYCLVAGVALTATWTMAEVIPLIRRCFRAYIWLSLALMFVAPSIAFWDVQGRELFGVKQLAGVTTHPNGLGTIAAISIFAELFNPKSVRSPRRIHLVAALVVLVLTQSRGAWLAAAIGVIFWLIGRAQNSSIRLAAPLMVAALVASLAFQDQILGLLEGTTNQQDFSTLNGRTLIWEQALAPVARSPWLGNGPLVFDTRFRWQDLGLANDAGNSNSHNQIIQTLVERGWIGLVILAVFAIVLLRAAWRMPLNYRGPALAIVMVFISRFAVETPLYVSTASLNGAVLVLLVALFTATPDPTLPDQVVKPKEMNLARRSFTRV